MLPTIKSVIILTFFHFSTGQKSHFQAPESRRETGKGEQDEGMEEKDNIRKTFSSCSVSVHSFGFHPWNVQGRLILSISQSGVYHFSLFDFTCNGKSPPQWWVNVSTLNQQSAFGWLFLWWVCDRWSLRSYITLHHRPRVVAGRDVWFCLRRDHLTLYASSALKVTQSATSCHGLKTLEVWGVQGHVQSVGHLCLLSTKYRISFKKQWSVKCICFVSLFST